MDTAETSARGRKEKSRFTQALENEINTQAAEVWGEMNLDPATAELCKGVDLSKIRKAVYSCITADEKTLQRMTTPKTMIDKKAYAAVRVSKFPRGITDKQIASAVDQFILMSVPFQDARSMMELLLETAAEG